MHFSVFSVIMVKTVRKKPLKYNNYCKREDYLLEQASFVQGRSFFQSIPWFYLFKIFNYQGENLLCFGNLCLKTNPSNLTSFSFERFLLSIYFFYHAKFKIFKIHPPPPEKKLCSFCILQ